MDALDAAILRELGVEPFAGYRHRPQGLRATDVAHVLGRNVRLVQDRITRMEHAGIIAGYAMVPNPRHFSLALTTAYVPTSGPVDQATLEAMADLDGFVQAIAYLSEAVCLSISHTSPEELGRRLANARRLAGDAGPPLVMYAHDLPTPDRELTPLDWRIIKAFTDDAKRPLQEAADDVGITVKTLRSRLNRMRDEGSVDDIARLDFTKMDGIMPFEITAWCKDPDQTTPLVIDRLRENYWGHFTGPTGGYCDLLLRVFTTNPAEANALAKAVESVPGVTKAHALMAAGAVHNAGWIQEAIAARI